MTITERMQKLMGEGREWPTYDLKALTQDITAAMRPLIGKEYEGVAFKEGKAYHKDPGDFSEFTFTWKLTGIDYGPTGVEAFDKPPHLAFYTGFSTLVDVDGETLKKSDADEVPEDALEEAMDDFLDDMAKAVGPVMKKHFPDHKFGWTGSFSEVEIEVDP